LRQAFAFFIELTQNVQARSLLGECALETDEILFRFGEQLFFFTQACLDINGLAFARFQ